MSQHFRLQSPDQDSIYLWAGTAWFAVILSGRLRLYHALSSDFFVRECGFLPSAISVRQVRTYSPISELEVAHARTLFNLSGPPLSVINPNQPADFRGGYLKWRYSGGAIPGVVLSVWDCQGRAKGHLLEVNKNGICLGRNLGSRMEPPPYFHFDSFGQIELMS